MINYRQGVLYFKKARTKGKKCWKPEHHTPIHTALIIYWVQGQQYEIFMYEHQPTSYKSTMKNKVRDISQMSVILGYNFLKL